MSSVIPPTRPGFGSIPENKTADVSNPYAANDRRVLGWAREMAQEGDRLNKQDPEYARMDDLQSRVMGNQLQAEKASWVPKVVINETKRTVQTHATALTDIRPLFSYVVANPAFQQAAYMENKFLIMWWVMRMVDMDLVDVVKYGLTCGTGDAVLEWDESIPGGGDNVLIPRDPRDTLPFGPSRKRSIQDWEGVFLRGELPAMKLAAKYPQFRAAIDAAAKGPAKLGRAFTRFKNTMASMIATPTPLETLKMTQTGVNIGQGGVQTFHFYFKDRSVNRTTKPVTVGDPTSNWGYVVQPGGRLYPRGRLIFFIENCTLYDGPNPYWHGLFPISRFRPDPWPWQMFGISPVGGLGPLQDGINKAVNWGQTNLSQHAERGTVWDKNVSDPIYKTFDPRRPFWKVKGLDKNSMSELFKLADVTALPSWYLPYVELLFQKFAELGETANFDQLLQLKQMPSGDTIEAFHSAMTPGMQAEGRQLEAFLRDIATMFLPNSFQFVSKARRVVLLGDQGQVLEDFDYDPDTMVPAMDSSDPNYVEELDKDLPRDERAQFFKGLFSFMAEPNSLLAGKAEAARMEAFQLARIGFLDYWTFMEKLGYQNVGEPPMVPLPTGQMVPQPMVDPTTGQPVIDPTTGQPQMQMGPDGQPVMQPGMEVRKPMTITEKLIAQQTLGIGMTVNPAGRKASGQEAPSQTQGSDGNPTIRESSK